MSQQTSTEAKPQIQNSFFITPATSLRKNRDIVHLVASTFGPLSILMAISRWGETQANVLPPVLWGLAIIVLGYGWMGSTMFRFLTFRESHFPYTIGFYVAIAGLLIAEFGFLDFYFPLVKHAAETKVGIADALYFSGATFTTIGYGDLLPSPGVGRFAAILEAILASAHSVFFVMLFLRGVIRENAHSVDAKPSGAGVSSTPL